MKRAANSVGANGFEPPEKRRKVRSCATCRRQKARCEFTTSTETCHRCGVLGVACVFEGDAHANLLATHGTQQNPRQFSSTLREPVSTTGAANTANTMSMANGMNPSNTSNAVNTMNSLNGLNTNTFTVTPNGSVTDKTIQDRLTTVEAALKEVLKATGLPALETFSQSLSNLSNLSNLKAYPVGSPNGYQRQSSVASSSALADPSSPLDFTTSKGINDSNRNVNGSNNVAQIAAASMNPIEAGLITEAQGTELMAIFEMRYNHCLYTPILKSHRMTVKRPFTFTVMCVLALRHKTTLSNQDSVRAGMNKLLQRHLTAAMSARPYTVDAIHGLLIMSLWSSVLSSRQANTDLSGVPDGWLLLATAVRMAQYLKLDTSAQRATGIVQKGGDKNTSYGDVLEEARVWYTLVTHDIAMSLGSVRPRLISLNRPLDTNTIINSFYGAPSDQCLAFHFDALFITSTIYNIPTPEDVTQIPKFAAEVEAVIDRLNGLGNKAYDAGAIYLEDTSCSVEFRMFRLYHQYCGCVCLSHASGIVSALSGATKHDSPEAEGSSVGSHNTAEVEAVLCKWMCKICQMAENVLQDAFPPNLMQGQGQGQSQGQLQREPFFFSTAPDHLFTTVAFCAAILIQSQVTAAKCNCEFDKADEYDSLVERTSEYLDGLNVGLPDAYLPKKYAEGLSSMLRRWRRKRHGLTLRRVIHTTQGSMENKNNVGQPGASNPSDLSNPLHPAHPSNTSRSALTINTSTSNPANVTLDALSSTSGDTSKLQMPITPNSSDGLPCIDDASTFLDPAVWLDEQTFSSSAFPSLQSINPSVILPSFQSTSNTITNSNSNSDPGTFTSMTASNMFASKTPSASAVPNSWESPQPSNASPIYPTSAVRWS